MPADIPARADADEQFIQAVVQRAQQVDDAVREFAQTLVRHSSAVQGLKEQFNSSDLSVLPMRRLDSVHRHWRLYDREFSRWRGNLQQLTKARSEDAASLTSRRVAWRATRLASTASTPALLQRVDELIGQIDHAEIVLSVRLGRLLDLGRKGNALSTQLQSAMTTVASKVEEQDWRLLMIDSPPLWQAGSATDSLEPVHVGLRKSLEIEMAFARDHDAAKDKLLRVLVACCMLLLPLMLWLKHRAGRLISAGQAPELSLYALSRPWAAWLVLVALGAVLFDFQGPIIRQQAVVLLAWAPVLRLLPQRILAVVGPWAYLSAIFYFLNVVASLLGGDQFLYRSFLLTIDLLMLVALGWLLFRIRRATSDISQPSQGSELNLLLSLAFVVLLACAVSNVLGNVSLATMLTGAVLDSSYIALAMYAGATVVVALFQVLLSRPTVSRLTTRHTGSLIRAGAKVGRTLIVAVWLVIALRSFRIYHPLLDLLVSILTFDFSLGVLSISLGSIVAFVGATWVAFWLAKTIRLLLAEDILPSLSLPRGAGNSISTLSYYTVLFLGLLATLAVAGFQVGQLTFVFGALGVGIGFGLQDIVKNFVSGLILMVERPVRPGDVVDVAGMSGTVRNIGIRATTVTTAEGADVVVPNGMLLADKLVNWTLSGTGRRIDINVRTGYGVAPRRTIDLLVGIARTVEGIASQPAPVAILTGLAPEALEFNLRAWTKDQTDWVIVRSNLAVRIRDGLAEAGIEIPLPQRDLHLRSVSRESAKSM
ncbi:MAG: mechanosensitive ion channel [Deltaproteobacteria bacterium]|nr:mechanosensitive ion channel [Deltaproteobacteria bacterium]